MEPPHLPSLGPDLQHLLERFFRPGRHATATLLALQPGERVLVAGVGTGLDLPYLPPGVGAVGIDVSDPILERAGRTATSLPARIELRHADAADTGEPAASFDAAILSLVLSVVASAAKRRRPWLALLPPPPGLAG
jgi:ubiquinone/menaquinone biosynthesis C-methylase UbiE